MSLASRIIAKQKGQPYELYFEDLDVTMLLYPMSVEQRSKYLSLKTLQKRQAYLLYTTVYSKEDNEPVAANEKEAMALADNVAALCDSITNMLTMGCKHSVLDKLVANIQESLNPDFKEHVISEDEQHPN